MRMEERGDKEVIGGGGFGQWRNDHPAIVYSLPITAQEDNKLRLPIPSMCGLFNDSHRERENMGVTFPTNFILKVRVSFKVKTSLFEVVIREMPCLFAPSRWSGISWTL